MEFKSKFSYTEKWKQEMNAMSKREEYAKFTTEIKAKDYLTATFENKKQRSALDLQLVEHCQQKLKQDGGAEKKDMIEYVDSAMTM